MRGLLAPLRGWLGVRLAGSTLRRELLGGLTTFLTMAYIVAVNPIFLSAAGMPFDGAVLATCLAAACATLLMGMLANYPIALAPGMGLNAFFAYTVCLGAGVPWQTALGLVFWAGVLFLLLTVTGARRRVVQAVPRSLRLASAVGIGLFIAFIGLQQGGLVRADEATLLALGDLKAPPALLALGGLAVAAALLARGVRSAIFWGLAASLAGALALGLLRLPETPLSVPDAALPGLSIDLVGALDPRYLPLVLVILFFDLFDTLGTLLGVAYEADLLDENGDLPRLDRALLADSGGSIAGALFGTSTVTSYIESGAGVAVGARTGVANWVTAGLFLLAPFATPLVAMVGEGTGDGANPITAPALILVGSMMAGAVREIDWRDVTEALPAFLTALVMPLTFNISHGLAAGIVAYALVKLAAGRRSEVSWLMLLLAVLIVARYAWLPL